MCVYRETHMCLSACSPPRYRKYGHACKYVYADIYVCIIHNKNHMICIVHTCIFALLRGMLLVLDTRTIYAGWKDD